MNKKDIAQIRKELKVDNTMLNIKEIYNVYAQKETGDIVHAESQHFGMLELQQQELYMDNFKKVLQGTLGSKLFDLKFDSEVEDKTQNILIEGLHSDTDGWKEKMDEIVAKCFSENGAMDKDTVFSFIRAEFRKPTKKKEKSKEEDAGADDEVFVHRFILCSVNKIESPKKAILFDYVGKEFKFNALTDVIVNLTTPLHGFLFPTFNNNQADVNHVLYSAGKKDAPSSFFIENVLTCEFAVTAKEEKDNFSQILRTVVGDTTDTKVLSNIYYEINKLVENNEDGEPPKLDMEDIANILSISGVQEEEIEKLEDAFLDTVDDAKHEFVAESLIPNYLAKSVKIRTKTVNVDIAPKDLSSMRQVIDAKGKRCLMIELDDDVKVEGFNLEAERLNKVQA